MTITLKLVLAIGLGLALNSLAFAAPPAPPLNPNQSSSPATTPRDGPISITADHMTANDKTKVVTFSGRVIARQDDLIISCDVMKVHYQAKTAAKKTPDSAAATEEPAPLATTELPNPPLANAAQNESPAFSGGQEIERVECEGAVKIQQGDRLAVGQKALYLAKAAPRRLILTGDARVWQGRNAVTGHEVTYFLDENRSQVESQNNSRVRAFYERPTPKEPPTR
ncbi:MAG: hypothetical protein LBI10_02850 [Deltaproteobacteria bacterium]|nr:hypothetical protein [Deltaproteobacteria bacterium]